MYYLKTPSTIFYKCENIIKMDNVSEKHSVIYENFRFTLFYHRCSMFIHSQLCIYTKLKILKSIFFRLTDK